MKNISEVVKVIREARSNAPLNLRKKPTEEVGIAAKKLGYPEIVVGVSMTMVDKLGINPRSPYNTPLGIYAYPYAWIDNTMPSDHSIARFLPFQNKAPHINVFSIKPSANVVNIGDKKQSKVIIKKIEDFLINLIGAETTQAKEIRNIKNEFDDFWGVSYKAAKIYETVSPRKNLMAVDADVEHGDDDDLYDLNKINFLIDHKSAIVIHNLWEILFLDSEPYIEPPDVKKLSANQRKQLAIKLQNSISKTTYRRKEKQTVAKRRSLLWNKLMREVGVDVVIDMGVGRIHENEKSQMVVFNPDVIERVIRIENVWQREKRPDKKEEDSEDIIFNGLQKGTLTKRAAIQILQLPEDAVQEDLYTSTKYIKEFGIIRTAIRIFISKSLSLLSNGDIEEFDSKIKFIESRFGKMSQAALTHIMNKFDSLFLSRIDIEVWRYIFKFAMDHGYADKVMTDPEAFYVFFFLINFLSGGYSPKISIEQRKQLLKEFFATDYWKKVQNYNNLAAVKKQAEDFLNKAE